MYNTLVKQINIPTVKLFLESARKLHWSDFSDRAKSVMMAGFQERNNRFCFDLQSKELCLPGACQG